MAGRMASYNLRQIGTRNLDVIHKRDSIMLERKRHGLFIVYSNSHYQGHGLQLRSFHNDSLNSSLSKSAVR